MTNWVNFKSVRAQLDFKQVLDHYGFTVLSNGKQQGKIHCPFHSDNKPSCGINFEKKLFHCFSCSSKGNVLDFVTRMEGLEPSKPKELRKAALLACELFGLDAGSKDETLPNQPKAKTRRVHKAKAKPEPQDKPDSKEVDSPEAETEQIPVNQPISFELKLEPAHPYLAERGLSKQAIEMFGLGYAKRGLMAGRICFPIHNEEGELIAYAGRWVGSEVKSDVPRYLLPKGFEKARVLYNLHRVLEQRTTSTGSPVDTIVIVEGFWSAIRLHMEGVPCVASFGASLSEQQVQLLVEHGFTKAILIFDGDEGGRTGTIQSLPILSSYLFAKTITLADGDKPDVMGKSIITSLPKF